MPPLDPIDLLIGDMNPPQERPLSPSAFAARVQSILDLPGRSPLDLAPVLEAALIHDQAPWVQTLIHANCPIEATASTPSALWTASYFRQLHMAETLLEAGALPDAPSGDNIYAEPCLVTAMRSGATPVALALIRHGANPNHGMPGRPSYLHYACSFGNEDVVAALLVRGANALANCQRATPAQWAREKGHPGCADIIDVFLEAQALASSARKPAPNRSPPAKKSL